MHNGTNGTVRTDRINIINGTCSANSGDELTVVLFCMSLALPCLLFLNQWFRYETIQTCHRATAEYGGGMILCTHQMMS